MRPFSGARHASRLVTVFMIATAAANAASRAATSTAVGPAAVQGGGTVSPLTAAGRHLLLVAPDPNPHNTHSNQPHYLIKLPPGFSISLYVNTSIPARFFAVGNGGSTTPTVIYVSTVSGTQSVEYGGR